MKDEVTGGKDGQGQPLYEWSRYMQKVRDERYDGNASAMSRALKERLPGHPVGQQRISAWIKGAQMPGLGRRQEIVAALGDPWHDRLADGIAANRPRGRQAVAAPPPASSPTVPDEVPAVNLDVGGELPTVTRRPGFSPTESRPRHSGPTRFVQIDGPDGIKVLVPDGLVGGDPERLGELIQAAVTAVLATVTVK